MATVLFLLILLLSFTNSKIVSGESSGELVCEQNIQDRRNKTLCLSAGCCHFNENTHDVGYGLCWSDVGSRACLGKSGFKKTYVVQVTLVTLEMSMIGHLRVRARPCLAPATLESLCASKT